MNWRRSVSTQRYTSSCVLHLLIDVLIGLAKPRLKKQKTNWYSHGFSFLTRMDGTTVDFVFLK
jgi:hypothetical protein